MQPLTLAFTADAREFLKAEGHTDFRWPSVNLLAIPSVGDHIWLDDSDPNLIFRVEQRTFIRSLLSQDVGMELELGLPVAKRSLPD